MVSVSQGSLERNHVQLQPKLFNITIATKYSETKKNFKVKKKKSISKSVTASRMEKLKAQEPHGSGNVWTNNGEIFCKLEGNDKPQLFYG